MKPISLLHRKKSFLTRDVFRIITKTTVNAAHNVFLTVGVPVEGGDVVVSPGCLLHCCDNSPVQEPQDQDREHA
jgi:hypothetical protein